MLPLLGLKKPSATIVRTSGYQLVWTKNYPSEVNLDVKTMV